MAPRTNDVYGAFGSVPTVSPETRTIPNPRLNVEANPNDFGAQIAGATEKVGGALQEAGDKGSQLALQYQGQLNETLSTNAAIDFEKQAGEKDANFKSLEGLAAVNAAPKHIAELTELQQNIKSGLTGAAAKSYDQISGRQLAFRINEANMYAGQQIKAADLQSATSQVQASIESTGDLSVASNDKEFNNKLAEIHFGQGRQMQNKGWDSGTGMQPQGDGSYSFDESSPHGKDAKAVYDQMSNQNISKAWETRLKVLADQNVMDAYKKYQDNYDKIPSVAKPVLDAFFTPKIRDVQSRDISENTLGQATAGYHQLVQSPQAVKSDSIKTAIQTQESGGNPNAPTSVDGAVGQGQITPDTFKQYAKPGEDINNPKDNKTVSDRIIDDYSQRYNGDAQRVAVAYFSGPGNVAPAGAATPWIKDTQDGNGKSVSSYVSDIQGRVGNSPQSVATNGKMVPSMADYYKSNYSSILENARTQAEQTHPGDTDFAEKSESRTKNRMDALIQQQKQADDANRDKLIQAVNGDLTKGTKPATIEQLTQISPDIKDAWDKMQVDNPEAASRIEKNMVGKTQTGKLGDGFSYLQQEAYKGNLKVDDLLYHVGDDLTQEGFNKLKSVIKAEPSSDEKSENDQMATFLKYGHERILHSSLFQNTPEAEQAYQNWFSSVSKEIQQKQKDGTPLAGLLDKESKDYVGKSLGQFLIPVQKQLQDRADRINGSLQNSPPLSENQKRIPGETPEQYWERIKQPAAKDVQASASPQ